MMMIAEMLRDSNLLLYFAEQAQTLTRGREGIVRAYLKTGLTQKICTFSYS
jgi:hypothetical protein